MLVTLSDSEYAVYAWPMHERHVGTHRHDMHMHLAITDSSLMNSSTDPVRDNYHWSFT